jgi:putative tricarboxylic transport membrane protein
MGVLGYFFRKIKFDVAPIVVALILSPMLESTMRESLYMSRGDLSIFIDRPISGTIILILLVFLVSPPVWKLMKRFKHGRTA